VNSNSAVLALGNVPLLIRTYSLNNFPERYGAYANALMVLTDIPAFPDAHGVADKRPEHLQRREPW